MANPDLKLRLVEGVELTYAQGDANYLGLSNGSLWDETVVPYGSIASPWKVAAAGDITPSVLGGNHFKTNNAGPSVIEIEQFDDGTDGQTVVWAIGEFDIVKNNANIVTASGADIIGTATTTLYGFTKYGSQWLQVGGGGGGGGSVWAPDVWA